MNENNQQQEIQKNVLARLPSVRMHSRAYFLARLISAACVALLTLIVSVLLLSFIAFSIHASGQEFLLGFGMQGVQTFLALFPWGLLALDVALFVLLEWLLQGFKLGYRVSLLTLFAIVCVASVALAALVNLTPLHASLLERADRGELPLVGDIYEHIRDSHQDRGIFRGTIVAMTATSITITHDDNDHDADDGTRTIVVPLGATTTLRVGERVYVFGTSTGAQVEAYGVGQLDADQ